MALESIQSTSKPSYLQPVSRLYGLPPVSSKAIDDAGDKFRGMVNTGKNYGSWVGDKLVGTAHWLTSTLIGSDAVAGWRKDGIVRKATKGIEAALAEAVAQIGMAAGLPIKCVKMLFGASHETTCKNLAAHAKTVGGVAAMVATSPVKAALFLAQVGLSLAISILRPVCQLGGAAVGTVPGVLLAIFTGFGGLLTSMAGVESKNGLAPEPAKAPAM